MKRADEENYLLFKIQGESIALVAGTEYTGGLHFSFWRPSALRVIPPGQRPGYLVWWALHTARVFHNREYAVLLVRDGDRIVHRSCVMPPWFRWPFMGACDVQISDTWTDPLYRGRGIAAVAARMIVAHAHQSQTVWYATQEWNERSIGVCRSVGMEPVGTAVRTARLGSRLLGSLVLT